MFSCSIENDNRSKTTQTDKNIQKNMKSVLQKMINVKFLEKIGVGIRAEFPFYLVKKRNFVSTINSGFLFAGWQNFFQGVWFESVKPINVIRMRTENGELEKLGAQRVPSQYKISILHLISGKRKLFNFSQINFDFEMLLEICSRCFKYYSHFPFSLLTQYAM